MYFKNYLLLIFLNFLVINLIAQENLIEQTELPKEIFAEIINFMNNNNELADHNTYTSLALVSNLYYQRCLDYYKLLINQYVANTIATFDAQLAANFLALKYFAECQNFNATLKKAKNFLDKPILEITNLILDLSKDKITLKSVLTVKIKNLQEKQEGNLLIDHKNLTFLDIAILNSHIAALDFLSSILKLDVTKKNIKFFLMLNKAKQEINGMHSLERFQDKLDSRFINLIINKNLLQLISDPEFIGSIYDSLTSSILEKLSIFHNFYDKESPGILANKVKESFNRNITYLNEIKSKLEIIFAHLTKNDVKIKLPAKKAFYIKAVFFAIDEKYKDNFEKLLI